MKQRVDCRLQIQEAGLKFEEDKYTHNPPTSTPSPILSLTHTQSRDKLVH